MLPINTINQFPKLRAIKSRLFSRKPLLFMCLLSFSTLANESLLERAHNALTDNKTELAISLFKQLGQNPEFKENSLYGLAKSYFNQNSLEEAERYVSALLKLNVNKADYLFLAGRIAGEQAKSASIFSKIGYAKDTKRFFSQALKQNENHTPSLIGLIRFHQVAPSIAGGDKDKIPTLLEKLKQLQPLSAFSITSPQLLENNEFQKVMLRYQEAIEQAATKNQTQEIARVKYDFSMHLSQHKQYSQAIAVLLSISEQEGKRLPEYSNMRLYQIGKLAAESHSHLDKGLESLTLYAAIPTSSASIPHDWVQFRIAQINYLKSPVEANKSTLLSMAAASSDNSLKEKVQALLTTATNGE